MTQVKKWIAGLCLALAFSAPAQVLADSSQDGVWTERLRSEHFGDRPIVEGSDVIVLEAPKRAEDAAVVPVSISAAFPQSEARYIRAITLLIDNNPVPLAGRFRFGPSSGRADIAMRVRVNAYTPMRAIAETNDGKLHMSRTFIKASGGCSAPAGADLETAMQRLGRMKLATRNENDSDGAMLTQLRISHPNVTGMQMDQVTRLYAPAHFIKEVEVSFNGTPVMSAETDISISENPSFRFYFVPEEPGELVATVTDSNGLTFTHTELIAGETAAAN